MDVDIDKTPKVRSEPVLYCTKSKSFGQHLMGTGLGFADCKKVLTNLEQAQILA
jgi:hypothetical protein